MKAVSRISGRAMFLRAANIDTDQIIPARFLHIDRRDGFAHTLFHDLRLDETGRERADFILNRSEFRNASVLVAGPNFACGSSREQAVWALLDYGVGCVIAPSFSDIFRNNALENGLLAIVLGEPEVARLQQVIEEAAPCDVVVDLEAQSISAPGGLTYTFAVDAHAKRRLLVGLSKIDLTLGQLPAIEAFEKRYRERFPWLADGRDHG